MAAELVVQETVTDSSLYAPQTNGILEDGFDEDERMKMRPADIDADVREMERRKRVEIIMNSRLFREELERIISIQMKDGCNNNNSAGLLQQISDMVGSKYSNNHFNKSSNCVTPINDIRGVEAMGYGKGEKILRCKLAALFRLIDLYGWTQGIYNHITARLSQQEEHFLVNPYGLLYNEITASSLVKVDMRGNIIETGTTNFTVNVAGFQLHAAIYSARPDLKCIIHIHTPSVIAVSALKCGLLPLCQEAAVIGEVSQHNYIGIPNEPEEKDKIVRNLGPNNKVLFLTNHGAVCCGETIEEAFFNVYNTVTACEAQLKVIPAGIENLLLLPDETRKAMYDAARKIPEGFTFPPSNLPVTAAAATAEKRWRIGGFEFEALMRMLDNAGFRTGYIYRQPLVKGDPPRPRNDVEVPPAVSSLGYLLEEEEMYKHGQWKRTGKGNDRIRWLNSPNVYQKVEILETGTTDPKKITKWVDTNNEEWVAEGSPSHASTPVKIDSALQFVPKNTNPKEFKKLQQQIKDNRRADKITSGPQSHILEGVSWEEAKKLQDANISGTGDQVILVGAASKGIIQREFQHNATVYKTPYSKNPFDAVTDEELESYKKDINRKQKNDYIYDEDYSESDAALCSLPPSGKQVFSTSETEEDSTAHETRVVQIETSKLPKANQAEVVFSDDEPIENVKHGNSIRNKNSNYVREERVNCEISRLKVHFATLPTIKKSVKILNRPEWVNILQCPPSKHVTSKSASNANNYEMKLSSIVTESIAERICKYNKCVPKTTQEGYEDKLVNPHLQIETFENGVSPKIVIDHPEVSLNTLQNESYNTAVEFMTEFEISNRNDDKMNLSITGFSSSTNDQTDDDSDGNNNNHNQSTIGGLSRPLSLTSISSYVGVEFEEGDFPESDLRMNLTTDDLTVISDMTSGDDITALFQPPKTDIKQDMDNVKTEMTNSQDSLDSTSDADSLAFDTNTYHDLNDLEYDGKLDDVVVEEYKFSEQSSTTLVDRLNLGKGEFYKKKPQDLSVIYEEDFETLEVTSVSDNGDTKQCRNLPDCQRKWLGVENGLSEIENNGANRVKTDLFKFRSGTACEEQCIKEIKFNVDKCYQNNAKTSCEKSLEYRDDVYKDSFYEFDTTLCTDKDDVDKAEDNNDGKIIFDDGKIFSKPANEHTYWGKQSDDFVYQVETTAWSDIDNSIGSPVGITSHDVEDYFRKVDYTSEKDREISADEINSSDILYEIEAGCEESYTPSHILMKSNIHGDIFQVDEHVLWNNFQIFQNDILKREDGNLCNINDQVIVTNGSATKNRCNFDEREDDSEFDNCVSKTESDSERRVQLQNLNDNLANGYIADKTILDSITDDSNENDCVNENIESRSILAKTDIVETCNNQESDEYNANDIFGISGSSRRSSTDSLITFLPTEYDLDSDGTVVCDNNTVTYSSSLCDSDIEFGLPENGDIISVRGCKDCTSELATVSDYKDRTFELETVSRSGIWKNYTGKIDVGQEENEEVDINQNVVNKYYDANSCTFIPNQSNENDTGALDVDIDLSNEIDSNIIDNFVGDVPLNSSKSLENYILTKSGKNKITINEREVILSVDTVHYKDTEELKIEFKFEESGSGKVDYEDSNHSIKITNNTFNDDKGSVISDQIYYSTNAISSSYSESDPCFSNDISDSETSKYMDSEITISSANKKMSKNLNKNETISTDTIDTCLNTRNEFVDEMETVKTKCQDGDVITTKTILKNMAIYEDMNFAHVNSYNINMTEDIKEQIEEFNAKRIEESHMDHTKELNANLIEGSAKYIEELNVDTTEEVNAKLTENQNYDENCSIVSEDVLNMNCHTHSMDIENVMKKEKITNHINGNVSSVKYHRDEYCDGFILTETLWTRDNSHRRLGTVKNLNSIKPCGILAKNDFNPYKVKKKMKNKSRVYFSNELVSLTNCHNQRYLKSILKDSESRLITPINRFFLQFDMNIANDLNNYFDMEEPCHTILPIERHREPCRTILPIERHRNCEEIVNDYNSIIFVCSLNKIYLTLKRDLLIREKYDYPKFITFMNSEKLHNPCGCKDGGAMSKSKNIKVQFINKCCNAKSSVQGEITVDTDISDTKINENFNDDVYRTFETDSSPDNEVSGISFTQSMLKKKLVLSVSANSSNFKTDSGESISNELNNNIMSLNFKTSTPKRNNLKTKNNNLEKNDLCISETVVENLTLPTESPIISSLEEFELLESYFAEIEN